MGGQSVALEEWVDDSVVDPAVLDEFPWAWHSRGYRALDYTFDFRCNDPVVASYVERIYAPFEADGEPTTTYSLIDLGEGFPKRYRSWVDGQLVGNTDEGDLALGYLLWHVNRGVSGATSGLTLVHAAAADLDGVGVVLPAMMESGKTTTVAGLVRAGFRYLTDEIAAIDPVTLEVRAFPKPMSLRPGSWATLADVLPPVEPGLEVYVASRRDLSPYEIRPSSVVRSTMPQLLIAPRYVAGSRTVLEPISRADMLQALASGTFHFATRGKRDFDVLGRLTRACDCYRLTVGDLDQACALVLEAASAKR